MEESVSLDMMIKDYQAMVHNAKKLSNIVDDHDEDYENLDRHALSCSRHRQRPSLVAETRYSTLHLRFLELNLMPSYVIFNRLIDNKPIEARFRIAVRHCSTLIV